MADAPQRRGERRAAARAQLKEDGCRTRQRLDNVETRLDSVDARLEQHEMRLTFFGISYQGGPSRARCHS